mmetsp:Transcript_10949/g.16921  ORF Transcript_10949/g.16921 Transcript_10949/m.16921 type:complete len:264 (-) Transcript_10949:73-864(-)|eukprot:CAMPEP_0195246272 /NCGR_PEP_ID=MMETSP0706-20130129/304_1 /TAXON_ID=33640 /ORGANISM="Asterionellopsis glacialis, Strain CCMP134" /LENGTH=263 /DNA_ID=CAMNT_0040297617 /DNA_START=357 /DNA_END=1148 /DNA_ORIENTATION=-
MPLLFSLKFRILLSGHTIYFRNSFYRSKLILISGAPGTGKSTFGMTIALDQGILKCVSTDTVRAVMRSFVAKEVSPALHRSSYAEAFDGDDPVRSWKETCSVLQASVDSLVDDAIDRKVSLVVEGVNIIPSTDCIKRWEESGGVALGVLLQVSDAKAHKKLLRRRGFTTGNLEAENKKIDSYDRIRLIQDEMMKLAHDSNWMRIEQRTEPDHLEMVAYGLYGSAANNNNKQKDAFHVTPPDPMHKHPVVDDELTMLEGDSGAV